MMTEKSNLTDLIYGVYNAKEGAAFYLSGSPTITGTLRLFTPVTLVGALTGGTYTVSTDHLGTDKIVAVGGSDTAEGAAYQITASDKDKFVVATGTVMLEGNQIVWTEPATQ
ncbi:MAG: hypothetical protein IKB33_09740 [Spirochaetaceae bacterium]|nr:hypothetical protein [Spirochaetaceae bacterium]